MAEENLPKLILDERINLHLKEFEDGKKIPPKIQKNRKNLPIYDFRGKILEEIRRNQVVMIKGETGCGKTTQVPQFILEDCVEKNLGSVTNILVTQPRRISAVSVANRVAEERGEKIGKNHGRQDASVGYEIRFESEKPRDVGSITFCTTGIIFQKLRSNPELSDISHIILDEVHERDLHTDVLLGVLKSNFVGKTKIKIVVMSASLDLKKFQDYLRCQPIEIPGRTFQVERKYLEDFIDEVPFNNGMNLRELYRSMMGQIGEQNDYSREYDRMGDKIFQFENQEEVNVDFVTKLIKKIHDDNKRNKNQSILVFLPGWDDISNIEAKLTNEMLTRDRENPDYLDDVTVFTLHSQVDMNKQVKVFRPPEFGKRKVILSTNIAETSVTIDDVVFVIDVGKINVLRYHPLQKASNLNMEWIAKSNADQRAGRAGRVQNGTCYHLFSRLRFKDYMADYLDPDIKRQQLEDVILNIKSLHLPMKKIEDFMKNLVESPASTSVSDAVLLLEQIEALKVTKNYYGQVLGEELTPLGRALTFLPLHPQLGKMVLMACFFRCLDPVLSIVAVLSEKDPFKLQSKKQRHELDRKRLEFAKGEPSDHIMFSNVINQWEKAYNSSTNRPFCNKNLLNEKVLDGIYDLKKQIKEKLDKMGILGDHRTMNFNKNNLNLIKGIIASAFYPQVKLIGHDRKNLFPYLEGENGKRIYINQKSVLKDKRLREQYATYYLARGNRKGNLSVQDCTNIHELLVLLFTPMGNTVSYGRIPDLRMKIKKYVENCIEKRPVANANNSTVLEVLEFMKDIQ